MPTLVSRPVRVRAGRWAAAVLALVVASLGNLVVAAGPASAHASLIQSSPGPGQVVGGTLDFVDLAFVDVVSQAKVLVSHNGIEVPGTTAADSGVIIRFTFNQPLTDPGRYDVTYSWLASDGHPTEEVYAFTYQPSAKPAFRIGQPGGPSTSPGGRSWLKIGIFAVLVVALAGLALMFLLQVQNRRSAADGAEPRSAARPPARPADRRPPSRSRGPGPG